MKQRWVNGPDVMPWNICGNIYLISRFGTPTFQLTTQHCCDGSTRLRVRWAAPTRQGYSLAMLQKHLANVANLLEVQAQTRSRDVYTHQFEFATRSKIARITSKHHANRAGAARAVPVRNARPHRNQLPQDVVIPSLILYDMRPVERVNRLRPHRQC